MSIAFIYIIEHKNLKVNPRSLFDVFQLFQFGAR
jgi:hypothetical protein